MPVPEAEWVVGEHRARLDRAAAWGVPAHVTVLHPSVGAVHVLQGSDAPGSWHRLAELPLG